VDGHELRTEGFTSSILPSVPLGTGGLYRGKKKIQAEVKVMNALLQERLRTTAATR
jgi:hypothetical protein